MQLSFIQCLIIALFYSHTNKRAGYGLWLSEPVLSGLLIGALLGDVSRGVMIGAAITPVFLAFTGAGGTVVWDKGAGGIFGCVITMIADLPLEQSITVAVPASLLFAQVHTVRRIWYAYPATQADKAAAQGKDRAIIFYGSWFPYMSEYVLYFLPMLLGLTLGANAVGDLMANMPVWVTNALSCVGGMLPSLGFAMTIRVIGRPQFLPFFLAGYFLVEYTGIGGLFLAFIGLFFAFIYYLILDATKGQEEAVDESAAGAAALDENTKRLLDKKDCYRMFRRWWWFCEQSNSFARLQSIAFCCAFIPALKKLYGDDPEEFKAALQRHLMFFNTQGIWGSVIHGIVLAMEEQRAMGAPIDASAITGIKAGLMGPFAGIGDTIDWATMAPLVKVLFLPLSQAGNPLGPILPTLTIFLITFIEGHIYSYTGFRLGTRAALSMLQGRAINTFISVAGVLGLFMMGGLSAGMVSLVTPLYIPGSSPVVIQGIFDRIAPGILPLIVILGTYKFIMSGNSMTKATLYLTALGLLTGAIGIFGNGGLIFKAIPAA